MTRLVRAGLVEGPREFAPNRLAIAVAPGNQRRLTGLRDLAGDGLRVVLADPAVPAGRYAEEALVPQAPWSRMGAELASPEAGAALRLSLVCSLGALAVAVVLGVPLTWVLARATFPGRSLVRAVVVLPMVLPPVVGGVGLLSIFGRRGLLGSHIVSWFGFPLPFTTRGVILAQAFVAMPSWSPPPRPALGSWTSVTRRRQPPSEPGLGPDEVVAVVGPNGAGQTTLLRALAGWSASAVAG